MQCVAGGHRRPAPTRQPPACQPAHLPALTVVRKYCSSGYQIMYFMPLLQGLLALCDHVQCGGLCTHLVSGLAAKTTC